VTGGLISEFLAILAGFVTMMIPVVVFSAVLQAKAPEWVGPSVRPGPSYVVVNLVYSFLAAMAGGFVAACIASQNPLDTALALAIVILVLGGLSALNSRGKQPVWYLVLLLTVSPLGAVAGGLLRMRMLGIL
jgi:hypothetical protein